MPSDIDPRWLLLAAILLWILVQLRPTGWRPLRKAKKKAQEGFIIAGIPVGWPDSGMVYSGSSGYGKTFASREVDRQAVRMKLPLVAACPKPTDANELEEICRDEGALDRFIRLKPASPYRINLLKYLTEMPGGNAQVAGMFIARLNDISTRSEGGNRGEAFWATMFEMALTYAIDLCLVGFGEADMELVKDAISDSPATPQEADPDVYLKEPTPEEVKANPKLKNTKVCALLINRARARRTPENRRRVDRATDFFLNEFSSMGSKARGAIMAMVNAILGRFLREPFYAALCEETTLTPEIIERDRLIVALDYDLLTYETPGRMFQLAWIMLYQGYCLRRQPQGQPRSVIKRDEAAYFTHPDYDAQVSAVSRSQRLIHFDLFQDFDLMESTYGGGAKAKNEAMSWYANHGLKVMFHQDSVDSAEIHSRLIGDHKQLLINGGGGGQESTDLRDAALGVKAGSFGWSEQFHRVLRPEFWGSLPVGRAVLHARGEHRIVDFRKGKKG